MVQLPSAPRLSGKQPVGIGGGFLDGLQHHARLDGHGVADLVDLEDAVHAAERQHDLAAVSLRRGAARHAGIAALGHDRDPLGRAELHDLGHFLGRRRPHDRQRRAEIVLAPVGEVGMLVLLVGDQALVADDGRAAWSGEIRHKPLRRPDRSEAEWRDLFGAEKKRGPSASLGATGASHSRSTLPGFMMFFGSSARLMVRMVSSSILRR